MNTVYIIEGSDGNGWSFVCAKAFSDPKKAVAKCDELNKEAINFAVKFTYKVTTLELDTKPE